MLNAIVLTGGPCVGKSTLIGELNALGHAVVSEKATEVITEGLHLPWVDAAAFRREVLRRQLDSEDELAFQAGTAFLDRGAYDGIAYCVATRSEIHPFLECMAPCRYRTVFLLEELPVWENDGVRYEDPAFTRLITPILEEIYRGKGAQVVRVPHMTVRDRLDFILSYLRNRAAI